MIGDPIPVYIFAYFSQNDHALQGTTKHENEHPHPALPPIEGEGEGGGDILFAC